MFSLILTYQEMMENESKAQEKSLNEQKAKQTADARDAEIKRLENEAKLREEQRKLREAQQRQYALVRYTFLPEVLVIVSH